MSEAGDFMLGPTVEFMRNLWRLNHALERLSRRMEATWGVTTQQRMIIRCIGKYPGMTASQLARQFCIDAGTVSTALARLERKGLIERRRAERDRRRLTLGLTAAGRSIDGEAGNLDGAVECLLRSASGEDITRTQQVLETFTHLLEGEGRADTTRAPAVNPDQATARVERAATKPADARSPNHGEVD